MEENEIDINQIKEELIRDIEASGREVVNAKAYEKMDISNGEESLSTEFDLIILQEKNEDGINKYEIFDTQKNKIGEIDAVGNITYDADFEAKFKDLPISLELDANELIERNAEKEVKEQKDKTEYDEKLHKEIDEEREPEEENSEIENDKKEEDIDEKKNLKKEELDMVISKDMGEEIRVANVLEATTPAGGNKTLEDKVGAPGRYENFAEIQVNGELRLVGLSRESGKYENIDTMEVVSDYDTKFASGDGQMINKKARTLYLNKGTNEGVAILQGMDDATSLASMQYDQEGKSAYGLEIPGTYGYVKEAVEKPENGSMVARDIAEKDKNLEETTGGGFEKIQDVTAEGNITHSIGDDEIIVLNNGEQTSISNEARKSGKTIDVIRDRINEKTAGGGKIEDAIEEMREEERGFSPEPPDREPQFPGDNNQY